MKTGYTVHAGHALVTAVQTSQSLLLSVVLNSPNLYSVVQTISTQRGARTMALDAKTHHIYTVTAEFGPPPPATAEHPHPWPTVISKTFTLLIFAQ